MVHINRVVVGLNEEKKSAGILRDTCTGYVRRVTHDEIADAVG